VKSKKSWIPFLISILLVGILAACAPNAESGTVPETGASAISTDLPSSPTAAALTAARINLNTATEAEFSTIPGVGSRMIREFNEYRPYTSISQFEKEIGKYVDSSQVKQYEQYVFVPVSANDSDAATLMQIAGLDADETNALIAARPYASTDAFLKKLSAVVSESELEAAKALLSTP
jgi:DNA uptake protein ComE-like DNA-binding protein